MRLNAQSSDYGNWYIYFGTAQLNEKWSLWAEAQYRNYNFIGDLEQLLLRTAIQRHLGKQVVLSQGYGFIQSEPYVQNEKKANTEHRLYQQLVLKNRFSRVYLNHRYRLEERFLEDDFRLRFRYFLQLNVPLNKNTLDKQAIYFSAYNEIFLHADSPVFDRNRVYAGLGYVFSPALRGELATMTQLRERTQRSQFQIVLFHNF